MSVTRTEVLPRTYATLRFVGDELDPEHISAILQVKPTRAHRKGQRFYGGLRSRDLTGRTGIWYFDTRDMPSKDLVQHLGFIVSLLYPGGGSLDKINQLKAVLDREHAKAHVSCFWYGEHGARPPTIPDRVRTALAPLDADDIDTDFDTD